MTAAGDRSSCAISDNALGQTSSMCTAHSSARPAATAALATLTSSLMWLSSAIHTPSCVFVAPAMHAIDASWATRPVNGREGAAMEQVRRGDRTYSGAAVAIGLCVGAAAGAGLALMLTPRTGPHLRKALLEAVAHANDAIALLAGD